MEVAKRLSICLAVSLVCLLSSPPASPAHALPVPGIRAVTASHGVKISLLLARRVYPRNALLQVTLQVKNVSRRTVYVSSGLSAPMAYVLDSSGQEVYDPVTPLGDATLLTPTGPGPRSFPLRPGKVWKQDETVTLTNRSHRVHQAHYRSCSQAAATLTARVLQADGGYAPLPRAVEAPTSCGPPPMAARLDPGRSIARRLYLVLTGPMVEGSVETRFYVVLPPLLIPPLVPARSDVLRCFTAGQQRTDPGHLCHRYCLDEIQGRQHPQLQQQSQEVRLQPQADQAPRCKPAERHPGESGRPARWGQADKSAREGTFHGQARGDCFPLSDLLLDSPAGIGDSCPKRRQELRQVRI